MDILLWIILNKCNTFVLCLGIEMCVECCGVFHKKIYILWKNIWIRRRVIIEPYFLPNLFVCDFSASVITMNGLMIFWFNIRSCFVYQCQWLYRWSYMNNNRKWPITSWTTEIHRTCQSFRSFNLLHVKVQFRNSLFAKYPFYATKFLLPSRHFQWYLKNSDLR